MSAAALLAHLKTGATHTCHCWAVRRKDGRVLGFTDHDRPFEFDGIRFLPETGLTAKALASTTGLSVNNTEAVGVLSSDAITEADIDAGYYDDATVEIWLVCWDDPAARQMQFAGTIGEISRVAGGFQAELRGLSEALNQTQGRSYLKTCSALLGDASCQVNLNDPAFMVDLVLEHNTDGQSFVFPSLVGFAPDWFKGGQLEIRSGAARGLRAVVSEDVQQDVTRRITLWEPIRAPVQSGDTVRLIAGCDKRPATCRVKFANFINFQGFPDIPGDDWLVAVPRSENTNQGGSRSR